MTQPSSTPTDIPNPLPFAGIIPDTLFGRLSSKLGGLSGVDKLTGTIGAFFSVVTNPRMWRSVGWFLLGLLLFIVGVLFLIKDNVSLGKIGNTVNKVTSQDGE